MFQSFFYNRLKILSQIIVALFLLAISTPIITAQAVEVIASSVTENFAPMRLTNFACSDDVGVTSNGSIGNFDGYCPTSSVPPTYQISYNFDVALDERMDSIIIWANAGNLYNDGELQSFNLQVDYIDGTGANATLIMNGVNIGDTANPNDPRTVFFLQSGTPIELLAVSQVRISNLGGVSPEFAFRELVGNVNQDIANPDILITKTASPNINVPAGTTVTYTYEVTNIGNQPISNISLTDIHNGSGAPPSPSNEVLTEDNAIEDDSSNSVNNDGIWDTLAPFDKITFTADYIVTQSDIDNLQ